MAPKSRVVKVKASGLAALGVEGKSVELAYRRSFPFVPSGDTRFALGNMPLTDPASKVWKRSTNHW